MPTWSGCIDQHMYIRGGRVDSRIFNGVSLELPRYFSATWRLLETIQDEGIDPHFYRPPRPRHVVHEHSTSLRKPKSVPQGRADQHVEPPFRPRERPVTPSMNARKYEPRFTRSNPVRSTNHGEILRPRCDDGCKSDSRPKAEAKERQTYSQSDYEPRSCRSRISGTDGRVNTRYVYVYR